MRNTKFKLTMLLVLGMSFQLSSQVYVGGKIGATQSNATVSGLNSSLTPDIHSLTAFAAGLTTEITLDKYLSLNTGISYGQKGFNIHESTDVNILGVSVPLGAKIETKANFIEVPLHLKYAIGNSKVKAFLAAGPSLSYGTSGRIATYASTFIDFGITDREIDFSNERYNRILINGDLQVGADFAYGLGKITTSITYSKGFNKFLTDSTINVNLTPKSIGFHIGYSIAI